MRRNSRIRPHHNSAPTAYFGDGLPTLSVQTIVIPLLQAHAVRRIFVISAHDIICNSFFVCLLELKFVMAFSITNHYGHEQHYSIIRVVN